LTGTLPDISLPSMVPRKRSWQAISQWLGHASLNTTMTYARADLDLKRQALMQVFPDAPRPPRGEARSAWGVLT
jgi:hypothetical protein